MSDFEKCLKLTFSQFSVARKPIINVGVIRPGGLLFILFMRFGGNNDQISLPLG